MTTHIVLAGVRPATYRDREIMLLTRQDKVIASIQTAHSLIGLAWVYSSYVNISSTTTFLCTNIALVALGIISAVGSLQRQSWGIYGGLLFFAIQLFHVVSPLLQFSFTLGFNLIVSAGFGSAQIGLNVFALTMFVWSWWRSYARLTAATRQDA